MAVDEKDRPRSARFFVAVGLGVLALGLGVLALGLVVGLAVGFAVAWPPPSTVCMRLWNAHDNASVRAAVSAGGYRRAALTADVVQGEAGHVCFVTLLDHAGEPDGTFTIWPDSLFDNGALHGYAGPSDRGEAVFGIRLSRDPNLTVSDRGELGRP